ncbi:MAG: hypothetical protein HQL86_03820 [Magnetococcales bacterium]|nr:hypothetical protein [Magnetococcales bacterium]
MQKSDVLRDKHLARTKATDLTRIVVKRKTGEVIQIDKTEEDRWDIKIPLEDRADDNRLRSWSFALTSASGIQFRKSTPSGEPDWLVSLTPSQGEVEHIPVYKSGEENLAMRPGESDALVLPRYIVEEMDKSALDLVAMRPVASKLEVERVKLAGEGRSVAVEKKEGQWPNADWSNLEEMLTQDALRGVMRREGEPWMTITLGEGEKARLYPVYKEEKQIWITPPGRPVSLELTPLQAENLVKAVQVLLAPPKEEQ